MGKLKSSVLIIFQVIEAKLHSESKKNSQPIYMGLIVKRGN